MKYLHYHLDLKSNNVVQVDLKSPAYIRLLNEEHYRAYREGKQYRYFGGLAESSPANIKPPHKGEWHLVIDLGDKDDGELSARVHIIQEVAAGRKESKSKKRK